MLTPENYPLLEGVAGYMEMGGIEKMDYDSYCEMLAQEEMAFSVTFEPYWHGWIARLRQIRSLNYAIGV